MGLYLCILFILFMYLELLILVNNNIKMECTKDYAHKCCENSFPQYSTSDKAYKCLRCKQTWRILTNMVYTCCEGEQTTHRNLDLLKDGRTDWTSCDSCGQTVNYKNKTIIEID